MIIKKQNLHFIRSSLFILFENPYNSVFTLCKSASGASLMISCDIKLVPVFGWLDLNSSGFCLLFLRSAGLKLSTALAFFLK